jgi:hypothetical protein
MIEAGETEGCPNFMKELVPDRSSGLLLHERCRTPEVTPSAISTLMFLIGDVCHI